MRAGIDIGGTFTDLVATDDGGLRVVKVPSTPDPSDGFLAALSALDARPDELLHGTTVATNAVLERTGARLGFVGTDGFRHLLHLARQDRPSLYDPRRRPSAPLAERADCVGVPGRLGPDGTVESDTDDARTRDALRSLRGRIDALAVTLLHAYANPAHERLVARLAAEELPGVAVSLSSDVLPELREYERASTTALNAYVQPVVAGYLRRIEAASGGSRLAVMRSGGGLRGVRGSIERPVHTLLSGPAAGVLGAAWIAAQLGVRDAITLDMGGTSADVSLVLDGRPFIAEESSLDGLPFRTPCIDVVSVGAGGGSIAWIDEGGALRVGPRSAGAVPGPAAYGRGGVEPTVTDAHVVAGHLGASGIAGGSLPLDAGAARRAIAALGLGDGREAAEGVLRVVRATMTRAIRSITIERGRDVRDYALIAFGGAGPLHATAVAAELGMRTVIVPPAPGVLAALGLLVAPRRADVSLSRPTQCDDAERAAIADTLVVLEERARAELAAEGVAAAETDVELAVDCRYRGQSHELRVPVDDPAAPRAIAAAFHGAHEARYGFRIQEAAVEIVTFRAATTSRPGAVTLEGPGRGPSPDPDGEREGVPVYRRDRLPVSCRIHGPAVVEQPDATTLVDSGWSAHVHRAGALVLTP